MIMYRLLGVCVLNNISNLTQIKIQIIKGLRLESWYVHNELNYI